MSGFLTAAQLGLILPALVLALIGWLVPIRESLSMIPQLAITGFIRARPVRKWVFVTGCLIQGVAVAGMAMVAAQMMGAPAGLAVLGLLVVFSLARALCSISSKDVLGKTIPKGQRGRLLGVRSSIAAFSIGTSSSSFPCVMTIPPTCWERCRGKLMISLTR